MKPSQAAFPKDFRLNDPGDYSRVFECAGLRRRRGPVRMTARVNECSGARLGLVVGKRALRRAVDRNRAKRIIRECFRTRRGELPALDIIVQVTEPVSPASLRGTLCVIFEELGKVPR